MKKVLFVAAVLGTLSFSACETKPAATEGGSDTTATMEDNTMMESEPSMMDTTSTMDTTAN